MRSMAAITSALLLLIASDDVARAQLREGRDAFGDWRLDNLFFTPDDEVVAVDWQLIDRSVGPRDLAYLAKRNYALGCRRQRKN